MPLDIVSALIDTDGSESLSITVTGLPLGIRPSAGIKNLDGSWTFTPAELTGLTLSMTDQAFLSAGSFDLTVTATSTETANSDTAASSTIVTVVPGNLPPRAADASGTTAEDTGLQGQLTATDLNNDPLTYALDTGPANGSVAVNADGTYTYTPNANFSGSDSFTYTVSDGTGTSTGTVTVDVTPVADAPTLAVLAASGAEDTAIALDIAPALADVDGSEILSVTISGVPSGASLSAGTDNGNGTWTVAGAAVPGLSITPAQDFNGSFDLSVTATSTETANGDAASVSGTLTVTVAASNDAPVGDALSVATTRDTAVGGQLTASDVDGDALSFALDVDAANGTATIAGDGTFSYMPTEGFFGTDSFTYSVDDGAGGTTTRTVTVVVAAPGSLILGTAGDDALTGGGDEVLYGQAGDDVLDGNQGSDELRGGTGADTLRGGGGDDLYVFNRGDGGDTIADNDTTTATTTTQNWVNSGYWGTSGEDTIWVNTSHWSTTSTTITVDADAGNDTLAFGSGIAVSDVALRLTGDDLEIGVRDPNDPSASFDSLADRITISNWTDAYDRIETLRFADGTEVDVSALAGAQEALGDTAGVTLAGSAGTDWLAGGSGDDVLAGGGGDDILLGGDGDDTISGGGGDDTLVGNEGSDTYRFGRGDGIDTLDNLGNDAASTDRLVFDPDIASGDLWFSQSGTALRIQIIGTSDNVYVSDWYSDTDKRIDAVEAGDGAVLVQTQVQQLVEAMAAFSPPDGTEITLAEDVQDQLQPALADAWTSS